MSALNISIFRSRKLALITCFLVAGIALFGLGNNWMRWLPTHSSTLYKVLLPLLFLLGAWLLRDKSIRLILLIFFVAAAANLGNWLLGNWLAVFVSPDSPAQDLAVDKLSQMVPVVLIILLLTLLTGRDLSSLYWRWGDWRTGLVFGLGALAVCAVGFGVIIYFQVDSTTAQGLTAGGFLPESIISALPWIAIFVAANALMEELWFCGLFLEPLTTYLGSRAAIILTSLIFALIHAGATYVTTAERLIFPFLVFGLGMIGAYMMHKTRSLLGPVLFHAGYDLLVILPVLATAG